MCPVRWSLKNQRTAQPLPIADIHGRIGISVCVIGTARADKAVALSGAQRTAPMAAFAGIRCWDFLDRHTGELSLVGEELFELKERPIGTILPRIRFGVVSLPV